MSDRLLTLTEMESFIKSRIPDGLPKVPDLPKARDARLGILSKDPMSPYEIPSTPVYFKNITEVMNRKQFPAYFPQSYTPVAPYFLKNGISPFFTPGEDTDYAYGVITVAGMVELVKMGSPWRLVDENDFDIVIAIAQYYRGMMDQHMGDPKIAAYAKDVERLLRVLRDGQDRIYRRQGKINPKTLDFMDILRKFMRV